AAMVGREVKVLFEKAGREPGQMIGKSEYLHAVYADAPSDALGQVRAVKVIEDSPNSLKGALV
ncbi:MAG: TRAM domain-containing protein, partial [Pseudomonadota bacterium]